MLLQIINNLLNILQKTRFVFYLILIFCIGLIAGCSEDSSDKVETNQWVTRCFTIVDSQTNLPVEGANLTLSYNYSAAAADSYYGTSDINGSMCGKIRSYARPYYWKVEKENYQMICYDNGTFPPEIINMDHASYLMFIIKNEEPYTEQDRITVSYKNLACHGQNEFWLRGINIDTTLIKACSPMSSWISIASIGANPFTNQIQLNGSSRDTTVVNIVY